MIRPVWNFILWLATLGCTEAESDSNNRATMFTNGMTICGIAMGVILSVQLPSFGVEVKYMLGIIGMATTGNIIFYLNHKKMYLQARLAMLFYLILIGWDALIIFGKTFNGFYIFFVALVYCNMAFSKRPFREKVFYVAVAGVQLPLSDWFFHTGVETISGLDSRDFPMSILIVDSFLYIAAITVIVAVEKSKADKYEERLNDALDTIQEEKQKIEVVFDNVDQGIVSLGKDLLFDGGYSSELTTIFNETEIEGKNVVDFLKSKTDISSNQLGTLKTAIDFCVGEDEFNWDLNVEQFPKNLNMTAGEQVKNLSLSWSPIITDDVVTQVILSVEDITQRLEAEKQKAHDLQLEQKTQLIFRAIKNAGLSQAQQFVESLVEQKQILATGSWDHKQMMRDLHSLKGESRLLELDDLSGLIHEMESELIANPNAGLSEQGQQLVEFIEQMREASLNIFSDENSASDSWSLFNYMGSLKRKVETQLTDAKAGIELGNISLQDGVGSWPLDYQKPVQTMLLHALQNSVDHGYLLPGIKEDVRLTIETRENNEAFEIVIEDFGNGLVMDKIQGKYDELSKDKQAKLESVTDILFMDSMSTAESTSMTSGRGVGLSAIKYEVINLGGRVKINNAESHRGSQLYIRLPKTAGLKIAA